MARADIETIKAEVRAFHAAEREWSRQLVKHYGREGSAGYLRARYETPHVAYPDAVRVAWEVRDLARQAWERACGMCSEPWPKAG